MSKHLSRAFGVFVFLASSSTEAQIRIEHQPVGCATAGKFPRLQARFNPVESVATARVVFQGQTADWYSVEMRVDGADYSGVLPKPNKSLKSFRYYLEVTDKTMGTNRTAEYTAAVVDSASCQGKVMAGALASASVILQGPAGAAALPAGFASTGVVAGTSSAAAGTGASVAGAGSGIGGTSLVVGGLAVAGGVAVAVGKAKSSGASEPSDAVSRYQVAFLPFPPGIDATVCGTGSSGSISFNAQGVTADKNGAFDIVWSPTTPVLRAVGQVTPTTFSASLSCTNGARTGSISATGSNGNYSGTFEFGNSRGQVTVTKS